MVTNNVDLEIIGLKSQATTAFKTNQRISYKKKVACTRARLRIFLVKKIKNETLVMSGKWQMFCGFY